MDDEDSVVLPPSAALPAAAAAAAADDPLPPAEDALEDEEAQDFRQFAALLVSGSSRGGASSSRKPQVSAQTIRKGEKDFEAHGTRAQRDALEQSRAVMEEVLGYTRVHAPRGSVRGWYFPDAWAEYEEDEKEEEETGTTAQHKRRPVRARDRVVMVEAERGALFNSLGRSIPGLKRTEPGAGRLWLLPEEALFLVERGSMDLWWPLRPLREVFPPEGDGDDGQARTGPAAGADAGAGDDEYEMGLPLSLQAAYSLLVGFEGERGKIPLQHFQVFSNLKRAGYHVMRAIASPAAQGDSALQQKPTSLWQWLFSLLASAKSTQACAPLPSGPLVRPGLYRSYGPVYQQLALIPCHKPDPAAAMAPPQSPRQPPLPQDPFRVYFHVWKSGSGGSFPKARPPPPDFHLAVADAQASAVPALEQAAALLASTPHDPPAGDRLQGPGRLYPRLKHGHRSALVAVVDHGIVNYIRLAEGAFAEEPLWPRFDARVAAPRRGRKHGGGRRGGKRGGGAGSRGRG